MTDTPSEADLAARIDAIARLRVEIGRAIIGQHDVVEQLLIGLFAGGHCLIEGVPGLGKTLLVRTLSEALSLEFRRVQFTPDLMPSDILGTELLEEDHGTGHRHFRFQKGPVFTNLFLADELNRTPPKTQAALLEAMQEHSVSYAGVTHRLSEPFFVLATQNPIEQAGTYPLPEAQLDRFLLNIRVDYPTEAEERAIITHTTGAAGTRVEAVMHAEDIVQIQQWVRQVHVSEALLGWVTALVRATRPGATAPAAINQYVRWGAGPRAGQALILAAKARAMLEGRLAATRDDIAALVAPVLRHRILLSFAAEAERRSPDDVIADLLAAIPAPA
ncbi:MoxR family ATPase [Sphingomonas sp. S1-29]|uniref:AAA family ATPase n=1 Tax=Sphingomonas sp. S1-29 TaxID=2991074 RepID=UPI002240927F|nr:MoxR family ATPase [Sphingomonas sp. S1-29]UZK70350.1 MoxR family ATPase [Sphingomonas sp. S1-29]